MVDVFNRSDLQFSKLFQVGTGAYSGASQTNVAAPPPPYQMSNSSSNVNVNVGESAAIGAAAPTSSVNGFQTFQGAASSLSIWGSTGAIMGSVVGILAVSL